MADVAPHVARIHRRIVVVAVDLAASGDLAVTPPVFVHAAAHVVLAVLRARQRDAPQVEVVVLRARVKQDGIMLAAEVFLRAPAALVAPDDFVQEHILPEDLVAQQAGIRARPPVQMQIQHTRGQQEVFRAFNQRTQQFQIFLRVGKAVDIRRIFRHRATRFPAGRAEAAAARERLPRHERRINIHRLHLPRQR